MPDLSDLHERIVPILNREVPVTMGANGLVGRSDKCAAWVDAVYLYSSLVLVRTCLLWRPDRFTGDSRGVVSLVDAGFDIEGPPEVETTVTIDAHSFSTVDGTLHFGDAEASTSSAKAVWWLPRIPLDRLEVGIRWPAGGLQASTTFDATGWEAATSGIHTL